MEDFNWFSVGLPQVVCLVNITAGNRTQNQSHNFASDLVISTSLIAERLLPLANFLCFFFGVSFFCQNRDIGAGIFKDRTRFLLQSG